MQGLNRVTLVGNLGADPELRGGGGGVLKLRLATTEQYLDKDRERQERTEWHSVVVFGKRGEALSRILKKGERLLIEGRLQTSSYEVEGSKRYTTEIVATEVMLLGGGKREQESERPRAASRGGSMLSARDADDGPPF